jgi:hypothetical protein
MDRFSERGPARLSNGAIKRSFPFHARLLAERRSNPGHDGGIGQQPCRIKNRNDAVSKSVLDVGRAGRLERKMQDLARYRAMESLCRQVAAFRPLENWRLLAEAEMWHHRAMQEIALQQPDDDGAPPTNSRVGGKAA